MGEVEFVRLLVVSCEIWISLVTETEPVVQLFAVRLRVLPPWGPPPWVLPPFEDVSELLQLLAVSLLLDCCNPTVTDGMFLFVFVVIMVSTLVLALLLGGLELLFEESPLSWRPETAL